MEQIIKNKALTTNKAAESPSESASPAEKAAENGKKKKTQVKTVKTTQKRKIKETNKEETGDSDSDSDKDAGQFKSLQMEAKKSAVEKLLQIRDSSKWNETEPQQLVASSIANQQPLNPPLIKPIARKPCSEPEQQNVSKPSTDSTDSCAVQSVAVSCAVQSVAVDNSKYGFTSESSPRTYLDLSTPILSKSVASSQHGSPHLPKYSYPFSHENFYAGREDTFSPNSFPSFSASNSSNMSYYSPMNGYRPACTDPPTSSLINSAHNSIFGNDNEFEDTRGTDLSQPCKPCCQEIEVIKKRLDALEKENRERKMRKVQKTACATKTDSPNVCNDQNLVHGKTMAEWEQITKASSMSEAVKRLLKETFTIDELTKCSVMGSKNVKAENKSGLDEGKRAHIEGLLLKHFSTNRSEIRQKIRDRLKLTRKAYL